MWLVFTLIAGVFFTVQGLLTRYVLKDQKDAWAYSFYFSLIGALVSFPFMLASPTIPTDINAWGLVFLVSAVIVVHNLLLFKSAQHIEVSVSGSLLKLRLVWIFLLGVAVFNETVTWEKLMGIALTLIAGFFIFHKFRQRQSLKGVLFALLSTILNAAVIILIKYLFIFFNSVSLTFFAAFLVPAIINIAIMPKAFSRITKILKENGEAMIIACGLGAIANLAINHALSLGDASRVVVIIEAFLLVTLVGEHLFLKERAHLWVKIATVVLATVGAILITISK